MRPAGRPRGESGTREAILAAARTLFAEAGYERASIRAIARRAGVDPALVHHYFGTKDELLAAAIELPVDPQVVLTAAFAQRERVGEALVRSMLALWEAPDVRDRFLALLRAGLTHPGAAAILRNLLTRDAVRPVTGRIGLPHADLRAELAGTQLMGLAIGRYVLAVEPLASASTEQIAEIVGPALQRYLTDPELPVDGL
jgi:AcrR family transcriptional regulator